MENIEKRAEALYADLVNKAKRNNTLTEYYDGDRMVSDLGHYTPPNFSNLKEGLGWCQIAIDSLTERINLFQITAQERGTVQGENSTTGIQDFQQWIEETAEENNLEGELEKATKDFLLYGVTFIMLSRGSEEQGVPETVISIESPNRVFGKLSEKSGLFEEAIRVVSDEEIELHTPQYTHKIKVANGKLQLLGSFEHGLGQVPIIPIVNKPKSSGWGSSELSKGARRIFDRAQRELMRREIASERYSVPQRYILGASSEDFEGEGGGGHSVLQDPVIVMDDKEVASYDGQADNSRVSIGTLQASSPDAFIKPFSEDRAEFANVCSIPEAYIGIDKANPSSADAIRMAESRLIKKAESRIKTLKAGLKKVLRLMAKYYPGELPESWTPVVSFYQAHTHTEAAAADAAVKLVQVGIMPKTHELTLKKLGLSPDEIESIQRHQIQEEARTIESLIASTPYEIAGEDLEQVEFGEEPQ